MWLCSITDLTFGNTQAVDAQLLLAEATARERAKTAAAAKEAAILEEKVSRHYPGTATAAADGSLPILQAGLHVGRAATQ